MLHHYTFNVYSGMNLLEDKEIRGFLTQTFRDVAKNKGFKILECEILSDHVHMLIDQPYTLSTSLVMKYIKGVSSRQLFQRYPSNRYDIRKLWARSFHCRKITGAEKETVAHYIKGQRDAEGIDKRY
jgi:putative transposase